MSAPSAIGSDKMGGLSDDRMVVSTYHSHSAGVTQLVECNLAKVDVAGSNPVSRSKAHGVPRHIECQGMMSAES
jgi:hypothetical protein